MSEKRWFSTHSFNTLLVDVEATEA